MLSGARDPDTPTEPACAPHADAADSARNAKPHEPRNFLVMALYQVVMRMGWIFKTESIVMPAVLDTIGGSGWLRGCLPLINRFGVSLPPILFSRRLKIMPRKKWAVMGCTFGMSAAMLGMALMFLVAGSAVYWWMPALFLVCYAGFFVSNGINQVSVATLQGKTIRANWRGRLMLTANVVGAVSAITCAAMLLPLWLSENGGRFHCLFGFAGAAFAVAAVLTMLVREPGDDYRQEAIPVKRHFIEAWGILRRDANFRRLAFVAMLFGCTFMLFPHYQALGREWLGLPLKDIVWWVIVQNAGTAVFSLLAGPLADWRGNRLALRLVLLGAASVPALAIALAYAGQAFPAMKVAYCLVFVMVGFTPVTTRLLSNYALEIAQPQDHPRYLSTLSLCMASPMLLAPLAGMLIDQTSFEAVFLPIAGLILLGCLLTFGLSEPRGRVTPPAPTAPISDEE